MSQADRLQTYYAYYQTRAFPTAPSRSRLIARDVADPTRRPAPQGQRGWEDGS